ncbi:hypothetical protein Tco_0999487 [Tanacetum coccineum]
MINSIKDLKEENRDMLSSINKAIKLMLAIATNMSCVIENDAGKKESKDNLNGQEHLEGNALNPWIPPWNKGEQRSRGSTYNGIYSFFYKDINLLITRPRSCLFDLTKGGEGKQSIDA